MPAIAPARVEGLPHHCVVVAVLVWFRAGVDITYGSEPSRTGLRNRRRDIDHHTIRSCRWLLIRAIARSVAFVGWSCDRVWFLFLSSNQFEQYFHSWYPAVVLTYNLAS